MEETPQDQLATLESPGSVVEQPASTLGVVPAPDAAAPPPSSPPSGQQPTGRPRRFGGRSTIYMLLFLLLLAGTAGATWVLYHESSSASDVLPQALSQSTLDQLSSSDVTVGEPQHTLSVQSNAVFSGDVLVRSDLQIAGNLQVGSNLAISGLRVTGNSTFDDVQITHSLALTGNGAVQGQLTVQKSLNVSGSGTFLGALSAPSLAVSTLQLTGDLTLTRHLIAGGPTPGRANGSALGSGGTASVSGSDTAGTITINTGGSPAPGCFATISFVAAFASTPHILATPVGSAAAGLAYYVNRSPSSFSICTASAPPAGSTLVFDYVAVD